MRVTLNQIDPELRFRGRVARLLMRTWSEASYRKTNRLSERLQRGRLPRDLATEVRWLPRGDGANLRVVLFRPPSPPDGPVPGVLWLHGGGYVGGVPEGPSSVAWIRRLIAESGAVVVAPEYRLAGEAPYPAALEDAYTALRWLAASATDLGARDDQLVVGGESAGGGLAAAVALAARDRGDVAIAFQVPLYPMLDDRCETASVRDNDGPAWDERVNRIAWRVYLGDLAGTDGVPPYAAPARAADLHGLPPAITFVGTLDPFLDEISTYVERLRAAGVPVDFATFEGAYHGFDVIAPGAAVSRRATEFAMACYRDAVARYRAPQPPRP
jgi:acetyl esterase/lipase